MIDWIGKLPDSMVGVLVAGGLWFGFNYAVLADRAMARDHAKSVVPNCLAALDREESRRRPAVPQFGAMMGMPELDRLQDMMIEQALPPALTYAEKQARCGCAVARAQQAVRFDYALYTASFRLFTPQSLASVREDVAGAVLGGVCAALPHLPGKE